MSESISTRLSICCLTSTAATENRHLTIHLGRHPRAHVSSVHRGRHLRIQQDQSLHAQREYDRRTVSDCPRYKCPHTAKSSQQDRRTNSKITSPVYSTAVISASLTPFFFQGLTNNGNLGKLSPTRQHDCCTGWVRARCFGANKSSQRRAP